MPLFVALIPLIVVALALVLFIGYTKGGRDSGTAGTTIVRCANGHLFTTVWIPGASLKAIRLGFVRFQRCPIGNHWTFVTPVKDSQLTQDQKHQALRHRDTNLP